MLRRWALIGLCLLPCAAGARLDTETPRRLASGARLDWVPCASDSALAGEARCAQFFPSDASGVRLPVVVLRSSLPDTRDSPVLYLPPGPGDAVGLDAAGLETWWHWQGLARWPHDIVLYDARGSGLAQPRLACPEITAADRAGLARPLSANEDLREVQHAARHCYARLRRAGIDPAAFNTAAHVRDVGELMALLGGNDWNLWGISYGTRLALHAAREYPARIRALVLDSVYPPEVNGLLAKPAQFAAVAGAVAARCAREPACARAHPAAADDVARLMAQLARRPLTLAVEQWPGILRARVAVNDYRLLWMLFLDSYRAGRAPAAHAVAAARGGDTDALMPLAQGYVEALLDPRVAHGVYYAVTCPEDMPGTTPAAYRAEVSRHPAVARHLAPEWARSACHGWNAGALPARFFAPVTSDLPALFLSGAEDIVTPPVWAAHAVRRFSRGRHHVLPLASHAVTWDDGCALEQVWQFLARANAADAVACAPPAPRLNPR